MISRKDKITAQRNMIKKVKDPLELLKV
jgi:hypothetical protein